MKRIILTGGGTAGHVTPNMALIPFLKKAGYDVQYIGSYNGIESKLITELKVPYHGISSGKLRRYFDMKNFSDPFKVMKGYFQASSLIHKLKPNIIFSKGGFVSVPVVLAAKRRHVPVIIHESDITPGLANKIAIPSATKVCCNFPETIQHIPEGKAVLTGTPIRQELFDGHREEGLKICGFDGSKPVLMVMGGSLGSVAVNRAVRGSLDTLLEKFDIVHLCGKGNLDQSLLGRTGYKQIEYAKQELTHLFAATDLIISRAGANAICELLALKIPNILIPLPAAQSRGDQILNAKSFEKSGYSYVLPEEELTADTLLSAVNEVYEKREDYKKAMEESDLHSAISLIMNMIERESLPEKRRR
ncbi:MAG: undecaprenyldiphospho-muramoylpentapeptide beta-N-acetylglucosaminyltransferase [Lachnospiraceae bacterium]|nr:undecaprenyldiphospho-muramoylpentapeptide beta-N-acetylglucosaminyltransferase [Lachnospiraceae bacterium]